MRIVGIETSCDECGVAVVEDGRRILSNVVATQIEFHKPYSGVVPEIASRKHVEWIEDVYLKALDEAGVAQESLDAVAVVNRPGLVGALVVGVSFAKALAYGLGKPLVAVDHIKAHLYAPLMEFDIPYPFLGLLLSGGHTVIAEVQGYDEFRVLGTTIDDACGEAFDKVAKHYGWGYPGGVVIDRLARKGNPEACAFPDPSLHKGRHRYDVSYSGLKTAAIHQLDQFWNPEYPRTDENLAAAFQKAAIDMILRRLELAVEDTGIRRIVVGGGVAANSYLRNALGARTDWDVFFPSLPLCGDNGAMVAGIAYHYAREGKFAALDLDVHARVEAFKPYAGT
ncbi:tRNA (adenosine(37)-N6)-threonylcarbamoyltransferase complex transferase subunit TsaD [Spirochaeta thermophila]|uniref:tRNA N6-adenosine threonylcarbamoyltransferase n=1 Tax=Winmispira thermophila (strain ATCC 49972 / DSM 6192 / RI 19.B1) TaxID=665571 RepID=E0RRJ0_WINT6|nr:tRNA (adenosine(37)-N6)-threonylcarbamoyltransferase complex transferase subunit TsaD [Spirochaeta thermophila]ADN01691.1 hypothetical protein STHERM_c07340 [Spirochaeta thermophila DSM 6192]